MINTNISKPNQHHDVIMYLPIERQIYDMFTGCFENIDYGWARHFVDSRLSDHRAALLLVLGGTRCLVGLGKKKPAAKICVLHPEDSSLIFGEKPYPSISLPYNVDVSKRIKKFVGVIKKIQGLETRAKSLNLKMPKASLINEFLNRELATDKVEVSFYENYLFNGVELTFSIHPKGQAPGDGLLVCLENNTNRINPFWNGSTERRTKKYDGDDGIEDVAGRVHQFGRREDFNSMKEKVETVEKVRTRIDAFDPSKSVELMQLIALKKQGDELIKEFESLL